MQSFDNAKINTQKGGSLLVYARHEAKIPGIKKASRKWEAMTWCYQDELGQALKPYHNFIKLGL